MWDHYKQKWLRAGLLGIHNGVLVIKRPQRNIKRNISLESILYWELLRIRDVAVCDWFEIKKKKNTIETTKTFPFLFRDSLWSLFLWWRFGQIFVVSSAWIDIGGETKKHGGPEFISVWGMSLTAISSKKGCMKQNRRRNKTPWYVSSLVFVDLRFLRFN